MDHLAPPNVPIYRTQAEQRAIWERSRERGLPVIAVRDAERDYVVHYDLQHLDRRLDQSVLQSLRDRVRSRRDYPTTRDPISATEGVGGEAGQVSGALHAATERGARELASHVSVFVLDRSNWQ